MLYKISSLTTALGVTNFGRLVDMILVTLKFGFDVQQPGDMACTIKLFAAVIHSMM